MRGLWVWFVVLSRGFAVRRTHSCGCAVACVQQASLRHWGRAWQALPWVDCGGCMAGTG